MAGRKVTDTSGATNADEVRVCRGCGHIDPAHSTGRCPTCDLFSEFALMPRPQAEQLANQRQRRLWRRRLRRRLLALAILGGLALWGGRIFLDVGLPPPDATTRLSASLDSHTWPQVRRTPQQSGFTQDTAPFPHRVRWSYRSAAPLLAAPAVVESHVYLAMEDGRAVALDTHTGQPVWEYRSGLPSGSTPAVVGDMVIVALRPGYVVALQRQTGARRWETNLQHPLLASPLVVEGTVYIGSADNHLYALDVATGQQRWAFATQAWIVAAVAAAEGRLVVATQRSRLHVVSAATGRQRLIYDTGLGRHLGAGPAIDDQRAYFGSFGGRVWAVDWQATTYPWEPMLLFWQTNFYLWGMRATSPVQKGSVWSRRVGGDVVHTPAIAHNLVYVPTVRQQVLALDTATGTTRWSTDLGVAITTAPTVADTAVLLGTKEGVVFALNAHTGEVLWQFHGTGQISDSPVVAGDTMYVVSRDGTLTAVVRAE